MGKDKSAGEFLLNPAEDKPLISGFKKRATHNQKYSIGFIMERKSDFREMSSSRRWTALLFPILQFSVKLNGASFNFFIKLNKIKFKLIYLVNNVVIGTLPNNIIKNNVRSIIGSYKYLKDNVENFKKIRDGVVEKYTFQNDFPVYFRREKAFNERYIFYLNKVYLSISTGLIWTNSNKILQESIGSLNRMLHWNDVRAYISLPKKKLKVSEDLFYYFLPSTEFYHFLIEELPAMLYAYREHGKQLRIILNRRNSKEYCRELLVFILGNCYKDQIIEVDSNLYLDRLVMVQKEAYSGFVFSGDIHILNNYLKGEFTSTTSKNIYISRRKAAKRRLANELELEEILITKGYEVVYLEELNVSQQIGIIKNAENVVAPHGAGLSHLVWGCTKKRVVEIFPANIANDCFARISVLKGYDYNYVICKNEKGSEYVPLEEVLALCNV